MFPIQDQGIETARLYEVKTIGGIRSSSIQEGPNIAGDQAGVLTI
jgi:hypothetical protein